MAYQQRCDGHLLCDSCICSGSYAEHSEIVIILSARSSYVHLLYIATEQGIGLKLNLFCSFIEITILAKQSMHCRTKQSSLFAYLLGV